MNKPLLKREATVIVCGLSKPGKMPCKSIGLPAAACNTGSKLALIPGSVCNSCYAKKGMYQFPVVKTAQEKRLQAITGPHWVAAMVKLISGDKWFRFHDSGDIADQGHFEKILQIIDACPETEFWIPTKESKLIKQNAAAIRARKNLCVRVSAAMIDADKPITPKGIYASTVYENGPAKGFKCRAQYQNGECKACRACWDPKIKVIAYPKH